MYCYLCKGKLDKFKLFVICAIFTGTSTTLGNGLYVYIILVYIFATILYRFYWNLLEFYWNFPSFEHQWIWLVSSITTAKNIFNICYKIEGHFSN